jgi:regulator of protease activity HflC (stomatin/prohibitin superfamily)
LSERDKINQRLQEVIDQQTSQWGVKVTSIEVRDIQLPQTMQRAMAKQAEAEREKRASFRCFWKAAALVMARTTRRKTAGYLGLRRPQPERPTRERHEPGRAESP